MSYNNIDERRAKKRTFFFLYLCTILVIGAICSAFFISPPEGSESATQTTGVVAAGIQEAQSITGDASVAISNLELEELKESLEQRDRRIKLLEEQLKASSVATEKVTNRGKNEEEEIKFLKWALSSQSKDVILLKKENRKLKAQLNDLKKYLN